MATVRGRRLLAIVALSWCAATFVYTISNETRAAHHDEVVHNQLAILRGEPHIIDGQKTDFLQFQGRVLFPLAMSSTMSLTHLSASQSYIAVRFLTAWLAFVAFLWSCTGPMRLSLSSSAFAALLLAYGLVFTFNHPWEHPTDFPDVMFLSLTVPAVLLRSRFAVVTLTLLATLNHQTAGLVGVLWLCVNGARRNLAKEGAFALVLVASSYALSTALKMHFGRSAESQVVTYIANGWWTFGHLVDALRHPTPGMWPALLLAMWLPVGVWLATNRHGFDEPTRRMAWSVVAIILVSSPMAYWSEIRSVFLTPFVLAAFACAMAEDRRIAMRP